MWGNPERREPQRGSPKFCVQPLPKACSLPYWLLKATDHHIPQKNEVQSLDPIAVYVILHAVQNCQLYRDAGKETDCVWPVPVVQTLGREKKEDQVFTQVWGQPGIFETMKIVQRVNVHHASLDTLSLLPRNHLGTHGYPHIYKQSDKLVIFDKKNTFRSWGGDSVSDANMKVRIQSLEPM